MLWGWTVDFVEFFFRTSSSELEGTVRLTSQDEEEALSPTVSNRLDDKDPPEHSQVIPVLPSGALLLPR